MSRREFNLEPVERGISAQSFFLCFLYLHIGAQIHTHALPDAPFQCLPLGEKNFKVEENHYKTAQTGAAFVDRLAHVHKHEAVCFKIPPHRGKEKKLQSIITVLNLIKDERGRGVLQKWSVVWFLRAMCSGFGSGYMKTMFFTVFFLSSALLIPQPPKP